MRSVAVLSLVAVAVGAFAHRLSPYKENVQ
jgi:hypothetical protein